MTPDRQDSETIPGPMPWPMRYLLERSSEADADAAARAILRYTALEAAHKARAWRMPSGPAKRAHLRAVLTLSDAIGGELRELTPNPRRTEQ